MKNVVKKYIEQIDSEDFDPTKLNLFLNSLNRREERAVRDYIKNKLDISNKNLKESIYFL